MSLCNLYSTVIFYLTFAYRQCILHPVNETLKQRRMAMKRYKAIVKINGLSVPQEYTDYYDATNKTDAMKQAEADFSKYIGDHLRKEATITIVERKPFNPL